jgi:hypothetical protein
MVLFHETQSALREGRRQFGRTGSGQIGILSHLVLIHSRIRFWYFQGNQSHLLLESHSLFCPSEGFWGL